MGNDSLSTETKIPYRKEPVDVSPSTAKSMLENLHPDQRNKRPKNVAQYAQDMRSGDWREDTEDTILFDWYGNLIDGQNRLYAVMESGATIQFQVAWGVDPAVMAVKDTGAARSPSDSLRIAGMGEGMSGIELRVVAAIARRQLHWESGRRSGGAMKSVATATHSAIARILELQPDMYGAAKIGLDASKSTRPALVNANIYGFFWLNANRIASDSAYQWQSYWLSPADLPGGSPIQVVRERFFRSQLAGSSKSAYGSTRADVLSTDEQLALLIRAWNMFLACRPANANRLQIARGKLTNDNFPGFITREEAEAEAAKIEKSEAVAAKGKASAAATAAQSPMFAQGKLPA